MDIIISILQMEKQAKRSKVLVKITQLGSEVKLSLQNTSFAIPLKVPNKNHLNPHYVHFSLSLFKQKSYIFSCETENFGPFFHLAIINFSSI